MWVKKLFPQTVARYSTSYNHDIRIIDEYGRYKLLVNGSRQSGEYIKELWQHAFSKFAIIPSPDVKTILVLGVAGGTVIHLLHELYPDAQITGVDIDQTMITVGKKYFDLANVQHLTLVHSDAVEFLKIHNKKWDMVVIDLFVGATIPSFVGEHAFLRDVRSHLSPRGRVLINYLREFEYRALSDLLERSLKEIFTSVIDTQIQYNRFFCCV